MSNLFVRSMLFISSYFPLTLIFFIFLFNKHWIWASAVLALGIFSLVVMAAYLLRTRTEGISQDKITSYERRDSDVMAYIATYLIPFVTYPLEGIQQVAALLVFLIVLLVLYVNSNMLYINPMLNLVGYHLYEITIEHSELSHFLITRYRVKVGKPLYFVRISDDIFLEKKVIVP